MIHLQDITKSYFNGPVVTEVLKGLNLEIGAQELVSIMGPSGSGKSTLLNILGLLDRPTSGRYLLDGEPVHQLSERQAARVRNRKLGFVFQSFNLLGDQTVLNNVALPLYHQAMPRRRRLEAARHYLNELGMSGFDDRLPKQLSGGQKQRVAIARALVSEPQVILADEPTGALDSENSRIVMDLLVRIPEEQGKTVVVITHDPEVAERTPRILRMLDGEVQPENPNHASAAV